MWYLVGSPNRPSTTVKTTLFLALAAALLAGCTISTELDPGGFQAWRKNDRGITGSNLPRKEEDAGKVKEMSPEEARNMQRMGGSKPAGS